MRRFKTLLCLAFGLSVLAGLYALNSLSLDIRWPLTLTLRNRWSESEGTTEPPATTSTRPPWVNPLLEIRRSGQRVSSMPHRGVVHTFQRTAQPPPNPIAADPALRKKDNMSAFDYGTCSARNTMCVVSYPLPTSIFPHAITFCMHAGRDTVSNTIRSTGTWESIFLYYIWATLMQNPDMHFIDMGANIGAMSLVAAKLGRQVIAVEPLKATLDILCQAVLENNVTDTLTIVPFALSDERTTFKALSKPNNWGGTFLIKNYTSTYLYSETVTSILTDDLLKFITFDKAFLKMDVEGFEPAALRSAAGLFDKVYIAVIIMEWGRMQEHLHAGINEPLFVLKFLYGRGYSAYTGRGEKLRRAKHRSWGENIHWVHDNFTYEVDPWSVY